MRRAILAMALGGVLLTGAACDSDADSKTTAKPAATPSAAPSSAAPDYSADSAAVCTKVEALYNGGLEGFNTQIGKMIANKEAKLTTEATKNRQAAGEQLRSVGAKIEKTTAAAQDPALQQAGATSAAKFVHSADDDAFFNKIKTQKDFERTIQGALQEWLTPVAGYCT
jgi:hypothetical protein